MLTEILQILESMTPVVINDKVLLDYRKMNLSSPSLSTLSNFIPQNTTALLIQNKLKNLSNICEGNYSTERTFTQLTVSDTFDERIIKPFMEPIFYEECLYYLHSYGSHFSILKFYLKYGEFLAALNYVLNKGLNTDIFVEIYMESLENGTFLILQEYMSKIDPSLNAWKDYLGHTCKHLQSKACFNSLYQLQLFMCDYIRASMICMYFYKEHTYSFAEMATRKGWLMKTHTHLQQALDQEQWLEIEPVDNATNEEYVTKPIYNPSIVMHMDVNRIKMCQMALDRQMEAVIFLADCEKEKPILNYLKDIVSYVGKDR